MSTTPGGIVYPDPTDPPNVPADLQTMAESIEAGSGWVTGLTGFTAAAHWSLDSAAYIIVGGWVELRAQFHATSTGITNNSEGNPTNVALLTAIPADIIPAQQASWHQGYRGRLLGGPINTDGTVDVGQLGGTSNYGAAEIGTLFAVYYLN